MLRGNFGQIRLAAPPEVLQLKVGDTCRVKCTFSYIGPAVSGKVYAAIWHPSFYDPHDEVAHGQKSFSLPTTTIPKSYSYYVDIYVSSGIALGSYGLYVKIIAVPGPDVFSPYYDNVIEVVGVAPKADIADWDFRASAGTYNIGDNVPFTASYKYKGKRQSGQMVLELGTGIYPTFNRTVIYSPMPVEFEEAMDWETRSLSGTFTLTAALEPGRTYSVRAKLETLVDKTQETDTDWGVITIGAVAEEPYITSISPDPCWRGGTITIRGERFNSEKARNWIHLTKAITGEAVVTMATTASKTRLTLSLAKRLNAMTIGEYLGPGRCMVQVEVIPDGDHLFSNSVGFDMY